MSVNRLHPLSAAFDAVGAAVQAGSFVFFVFVMLRQFAGTDLGLVFVLAPLGALAGLAYAVARYLRYTYELAGDTFVVESGVVARQRREIPLRRVQNVDVTRNAVHRVFGLAVVRIETAGGGGTEAELDAVSADEADRLRTALTARRRRSSTASEGSSAAAGEGTGTDAGTDTDADAASGGATAPSTESAESPAAESERVLFSLSATDLLALCLVSFRPGAALIPIFGFPFAEDVALAVFRSALSFVGAPLPSSPAAALSLSPEYVAVVAAVGLSLFALTSWAVSAALTFAGYYGFRLSRVGDELRYEQGLVQRYSGTVPLDKVQTVAVDENALMRALGYASLRVETAGYAPGSSRSGGAEEAVPLAARSFVYGLAHDIEPFGEGEFVAPPRRARRRYAGRYLLAVAGATVLLVAVSRLVVDLGRLPYAPLLLVPVAPVAAHLKWRSRGYRLDADHLVTRTGFWRRTTRVVPYFRVQTVFERRTPFQRRWGLANVTADTASSASLLGRDATAFDVDDAEARELHETLRVRLRERLGRPRSGPA